MDVVGVVVVVEVDGRDNMELGMEDIVYFSHKLFSNLVAKIGLRVEMAKVSKERVCFNYYEMDVHNLEIVN